MTIYSDSGDAVLHVDDIVETWVKDKLRADGWSIDLNDVDIQIHWPHNAFKHSTQIHDAFSAPRPSMQLMNTQSFKNNSDKVQQLTFNVQRSTQASAEVTILRGFQIPSRHRLLISSPGDSPFSDLLLKDTETSKWTEQQRWQVESPVHVNPRSISTARLLLSETDHSARFTITTQVQGKVKIIITQNGQHVRKLEGDLTSIFRDRKHGAPNGIYGDRPVRPQVQRVKDGNVFLLTEGQMNMRYGIHQEVTVNEEPWDGTETDSEDEDGTEMYPFKDGRETYPDGREMYSDDEDSVDTYPADEDLTETDPEDEDVSEMYQEDEDGREIYQEDEDGREMYQEDKEGSEMYHEDDGREMYHEDEDGREMYHEDEDGRSSSRDDQDMTGLAQWATDADDSLARHKQAQGYTNSGYTYNEYPSANTSAPRSYRHGMDKEYRIQIEPDAWREEKNVCACSSCIIM